MQRDFAKIIRASCGAQVLFYVEPDGDACRLHQVVNTEDVQADLAAVFDSDDADENERKAFKALDGVGVDRADKVVAHVLEMTGLVEVK